MGRSAAVIDTMRTIEIRRHGHTKKGEGRGKGSHLSTDGVALARKVGGEIGPFDLVLTSPAPRALETAVAMGFAVNDQLEALGDLPPAVWEEIGHHERWVWEEPFVTFAHLVRQGGPTARVGERQRQAWVSALESVSGGARVLMISHGRIIEAGLVTCIPDGDFAAWGASFHHCEGVRMTFAAGRFQGVQLLRVLSPVV
jgi:broad specificity phosphatase PhoE